MARCPEDEDGTKEDVVLKTFTNTLRRVGMAVAIGLAFSCCASGAEVCFEAELANRIVPMMEITERKDASGGLCLAVGEGAGRLKSPGPGAAAAADFWIQAPEKGIYHVWARTLWIGGCSNSVNISIDGGAEHASTDRTYDRWHWVGGPVVSLDAGDHLVTLSNREDGILIDQVWLTTTPAAPTEGARTPTQTPLVPAAMKAAALRTTLSGVGNVIDRPQPLFGEKVAGDARVCSLFVLPGKEARATLWLRNNAPEPWQGTLKVETRAGLGFGDDAPDVLTVPPNGLLSVPLTLPAAKASALRRLAVPVTLRLATGGAPLDPVRLVLHATPRWRKYGPVAGARPEQAFGRLGEALKKEDGWTAFDFGKSFDQFGRFDLNAAFGGGEFMTGFARMRLQSDKARSVDCYLAHDDHMVAWVNGKAIFSADYVGPASDSRARVPLPLKAGANDILLAVGEEQHRWHFAFIVTPPADAGVTLPEEQ